jgi:CRP-like cAMP-binding protein
MKEFISYILQFGNLNQEQIDYVSKKATILELNKDKYFWEAGKTTQYIGFLTEGIIRVCYYSNKGEEITRYFIDENNLIIESENFEPTIYLQAVTNCKLIIFSKSDWAEFSQTIIAWDNIINKIVQKTLIQKLQKRSSLIEQDATARYLTFIEKFPKIANRVPLAYIASYLGITQSSLSRIRKKSS